MTDDATLTQLTCTVRCGDPVAVSEMLAIPEAVLIGHFELLSGLHTDTFIAFSRIADDTEALERIAGWLAPSLAAQLPDALLAPSTAGVGLGWALARQLGVPLHLAALDDRSRASGLLGAPAVDGQRIAMVNDVVTTGRGVRALAEVSRAAGAVPAVAAWFVSRRDIDVQGVLGVPGVWVADVPLPAWPADECPLCGEGRPLQLGLDLN